MMLVSVDREDPELISREIIFDVVRTDRHTDGQTTCLAVT